MDKVVKPRLTVQELKDPSPPDPLNTHTTFMTLNNPGVTAPQKVPGDFAVRSIFPAMRTVAARDLPILTKEYFLFHHGVWFTWGGLQLDPLLEFYLRDGEHNKCVQLVPVKERILFGVARNSSEAAAESSLFAIPRDRMRDVLFWLDGVTVAHNGVFQWVSGRQHIPFDPRKTGFNDKDDTEYLALYGIRTQKDAIVWSRVWNGFGVKRVVKPMTTESQASQIIVAPGT